MDFGLKIISENDFIIGLNLLDDDGWRHFVSANVLRIDDDHSLHRGEPNPPIAIRAARRLIVSAIALAAEHTVRLAQGKDLDVTYAHTVALKPPRDDITTRVYYDVVRCRTHRWNIYSVDDTIRLPPR